MDAGLLDGFAQALSFQNLLYALLGCLIGTAVGVLPGLGSAATMAILLPTTFYLAPEAGIIMLAGIFYGARYGGSTTAILLNIPGEEASVPATLDGHEMSKQGRAGQALAIAAIGSFIAGTFGALVISVLGPPIARLGLEFGPAEYFGLVVFGLTAIISFSGQNLRLGALSGLAGMWLAVVGLDPLTGVERMTFDNTQLLSGLNMVALLVGLFGVGEVLDNAASRTRGIFTGKLGSWWSMIPRGKELRRGLAGSARGTGIGFGLGVIPGVVTALTSFVAYDVEKRLSKHPERFGRGAIEGVAAPEAANNGAAMGGFVPLLSLGIPTGPSLAILLAALLVYGLTPGPNLFAENGTFVWTVIASMYIANVLLVLLNLPLVKLWAQLSRVPYRFLGPIILAVCVVGAYSSRNSMFDVWTALAFGVIGFGMRRLGVPLAPMVLGFILGPLLEQSLRQSLQLSGGSLSIFVNRPVAFVFLLLAALTVVSLAFLKWRARNRTRGSRLATALAVEED